MLHGHSLIYFGPGPWEGMWRNRHQLMSRFAHHNRVLYVEPPHYLQRLRALVKEKGWQELGRVGQASGLRSLTPKLHVYRGPVTLPLVGRPPFERLTRELWLRALQAVLRRLNFDKPILWLARPEWQWVIGRLAERLTIYHVVDEYSAYQDLTADAAEHVRQLERQILRRADLVVAVSPPLAEAKRALNPHTYLVANGVDAAAFNQHPMQPPAEMIELPAPRLVYAGLIGARLDLALLITLARRRPEWSLVLLGEVNARGVERIMAELRAQPNVHFLGVKPISEVPAYLAAGDVCLLPYRRDSESQHIDPLKLYEGLAAGKPIVATPIPAMQPFREMVRLAINADEMERQVSAALHEAGPECAARRSAAVAEHTWEARVEQLSQLIYARLPTGG